MELDGLDPAPRQRLQSLLDTYAAQAQPCARVGGGDRRYFTIDWDGAGQPLRVAVDKAPAGLLRLWRDGAV